MTVPAQCKAICLGGVVVQTRGGVGAYIDEARAGSVIVPRNPMSKRHAAVALLFASLLSAGASVLAQPARLTDEQVRRALIRESIEAYAGRCPCPYQRDSRGRACGRRSAWSRQGGEAPYCYPNDVPAEAVAEWRRAHETP